MKLGSLKAGGRDGTLIVVDRALQYYVTAGDVAPTMQSAMDNWSTAAPLLNAVYGELEAGRRDDAKRAIVEAQESSKRASEVPSSNDQD